MAKDLYSNMNSLLKEVQRYNTKSTIAQVITAKSTAEIAGPDDDKQEKLLTSIDNSLTEIKNSLAAVVKKALGTKGNDAKDQGTDKEATTESKRRKEVKKDEEKTGRTLMGDMSDFLQGMKDANKEIAGYLLGKKEDEPVLPPKAATEATGINQDEGLKGDQVNPLILEQTQEVKKAVQESNKTLEKHTGILEKQVDVFEKVFDKTVDIHKLLDKNTPKTLSQRSFERNAPTKVSERPARAADRNAPTVTAAPSAAVAPLSATTTDVDKEYTQAARIQKEQDIQAQAEANAEAAGTSGGFNPLDLIPGKGVGKLATAAKGGGKLLKGLGTAAKIGGKMLAPLGIALAAGDAIGGYMNAEENLGIQDREATFGEKLSSGAGSLVSGLSFGLIDEKAAAKNIKHWTGAGPDNGSKVQAANPMLENEYDAMGNVIGTKISETPATVSKAAAVTTPSVATTTPSIASVSKAPANVEEWRAQFANNIRSADNMETIAPTDPRYKEITSRLNNPANLVPSAPSTSGGEMQVQSSENKMLSTEAVRQAPVRPIVQNSVQNNNSQTFVPMKPTPRSSGTSFERMLDRVAMG